MGLRLDPPAHEAVGQMMDPLWSQYQLYPEASCVSVPMWTFQPRFKHPAPPQSRLGAAAVATGVSHYHSSFSTSRRKGRRSSPVHLCGHMTCFAQ